MFNLNVIQIYTSKFPRAPIFNLSVPTLYLSLDFLNPHLTTVLLDVDISYCLPPFLSCESLGITAEFNAFHPPHSYLISTLPLRICFTRLDFGNDTHIKSLIDIRDCEDSYITTLMFLVRGSDFL